MAGHMSARIALGVVGCLMSVAAPSRAGHHDTSLVPPSDEIEILDPHVDSEGKPRAILVPSDPNSMSRVEVPPTVLHHRYYYTGDRDFQGPMLPGGPSIVLVNHPVTGEQQQISVQLMPGAPRVYYRRNYIRYDYGSTKITLHFGHLTALGIACEPKVVVCHHVKPRNSAAARDDHYHQWVERTGIPQAVGYIKDGTVRTLDSTADRIHDVGQTVTTPFVQIWERTPLGSAFSSSAEERAARARDAAVQRAGNITDPFSNTIPTLR